MSLASLRSLLVQPPSQDSFRQIVSETATLVREPGRFVWFFLLLNRVFAFVLDDPELLDPDTSEPILETLYQFSRNGLDAIEADRVDRLIEAANSLAAAYSVLP